MSEQFLLWCIQCGNSFHDSDRLCTSCGAAMSQTEYAWHWKEIKRLKAEVEELKKLNGSLRQRSERSIRRDIKCADVE